MLPRFALAIAAILATCLLASQSNQSPEAMLEAAIYRAQVLGDLPGAIKQFEAIAERYAGKPVAGRALIELGQAEELLGHDGRARAAYLKAMSDYPDELERITRLHQHPESVPDATIKAQGLTWTYAGQSLSPSARCCNGLAYDPATHSTVLFGGFTPHVCFGDTWIWHDGWRQLTPATAPSPRTGPAMVYDGAAGKVVLFGGVDTSGASLNDTWTWDGSTWTQQFPPVAPPRRVDGAAAYDAEIQRVVLFGGANGTHVYGDTWLWDGKAKTWSEQFPARSPSARRSVIAYDENSKRVVLFGGHTGAAIRFDQYYGDTWTWDSRNWTQHTPGTSPSARGMAPLAYDPNLGAVVLVGGSAGFGRWTNETWLWTGTDWKELHPPAAPSTRWNFHMDYDADSRGLLIYGGFSSFTLGDTWILKRVP